MLPIAENITSGKWGVKLLGFCDSKDHLHFLMLFCWSKGGALNAELKNQMTFMSQTNGRKRNPAVIVFFTDFKVNKKSNLFN